jgi:hypothetical protein
VDHPAAPGAGVIAALLAMLAAVTPAAADGRASVIVVVGAPGTAEYGGRFAGWAERWKQACAKADAHLTVVGLDAGGSDRQRLADLLGQEAVRPRGDLWLVLLGHGTFDGRTAKFNLRGTDVSADELAKWLGPIHRSLVVIDATSASAPFVKALSGPDRVIITATRSGREQNVTRFGGVLADTIADPQADLDKDGQTSLLEAFLVAARRVDASYTEAGLLATEHALLDDNGDGLGTGAGIYQGLHPAKVEGGPVDGRRAHQLSLVPSEPEKAMPPELRRRRDQLELQVLQLRDGRSKLSDDEYYRRMEPLVLELSRLYQRAERR